MAKKENKKQNKKEIILNDRFEDFIDKSQNSNNNQDENLIIYNDLKDQLKLNLKDDIDNKIQRMKILYKIKQKELYKYDGFKSFEQFIKSFIIAKTQAYTYLKVYEKVLEGVISIDKIKEVGFNSIYHAIQKQGILEINQENINKNNKENIPIRILIKDNELYDFCKKDTKRVYFILKEIFKNKKDILSEIIIKYDDSKKKRNK
ncbi:chromosome replication/partitioning protein (plasmid) [Borreliella garinii]|uniref:chromosome replication/partitioning protein n=1 Tax=Borreliella garinii TaxID=29519 RepID=UPI00292D3FDD|nr:chromosome replication/partitioning protein [Borreliella garinii]WNZ67170.1 chromosome replication/partitioning protein [Borreliella garinii]WNZ68168.1 chromosome replication/partitioning protein [Borreliella garinii]WNZ69168.1 chromosome replication/partitioning protein [Borreliella garinii]WNZ71172.1 chromosome replication/partitioning protein [Borreliella garinii]